MADIKRSLILAGGGGKGAFQGGVLEVLDENGFKWFTIDGVSVGGLCGAGLAVGGVPLLKEVWLNIKEEDVFKKYSWPHVIYRLATKQRGIYDNSPLFKTINKYIGYGPYPNNINVGVVSMFNGKYYSVPGNAETVWGSATIPIVFAPLEKITVQLPDQDEPLEIKDVSDGGLRTVTPLGDAILRGADEIVVILCNPRGINDISPSNGIVDDILRSFEIIMDELAINDIERVLQINELVRQAEENGVTLYHESGRPYRYIKIYIIEPPVTLGKTLDFKQKKIQERWQFGKIAGEQFLLQYPETTF